MVAVDAEFQLAVLAIDAGIQTSEEGDGFEFLLGGFVVMLEATFAALGARTPQVVIIA